MNIRLCPISTKTEYRAHAEEHVAAWHPKYTYCHLASRHYWSRVKGQEVNVTCFGPRLDGQALGSRRVHPGEVAIQSVDGGPWEFVEVWE